MLLRKCLTLLSLPLLLSAMPAHAGAWPQAAGTLEVIAGATYSESDSGFDGRVGGTAPKFRKLEVAPLISWGVGDDTTISFQPSWQRLKADNATGGSDKGSGLADAEFAVRRTIWQDGGQIVALAPLIAVPLGYDKGDQPPLGSGKVDAEMRALYGHGFNRGFIDAQVAYRTRGGPAADELRLDLTAGYRPDTDWLLLAQSFSAVSVGTPGTGYGDVRRYKLQWSAVRKLTDDVSLQFGLSKAIGGRNAGGERMALLALWWNFGRR